MTTEKKECPQVYLACPSCQGFIKKDIQCRWGYVRSRAVEAFPPGLEPEPSKIGTVKSRW